MTNYLSEKEGLTVVYDYDDLDNLNNANFDVTGYRLPSEAEFELAAKGTGSYIKYTLGITNDPIAKTDANYDDVIYDVNLYDGTNGREDQRLFGYGFADILGNVREWVTDWYIADYTGLGINPICKNDTSGLMVIKGGGFSSNAEELRCSNREKGDPTTLIFNDVGFRIVKKK